MFKHSYWLTCRMTCRCHDDDTEWSDGQRDLRGNRVEMAQRIPVPCASALCSVPRSWETWPQALHELQQMPSEVIAPHFRCPVNLPPATHHTHTHTHARLTALCPGLPRWAGTRKVKPIWILLKQERPWVAVASGGPYASLHFPPDR